MQKHEVSATLLFGVGLPLAGWLAGTYIGNVPLSPFPQALTAALHATPNNPFIVGGVVAGLALAASAAYLFHEYGDDGFRARRIAAGCVAQRWRTGTR